ncbi:hypothetical protein [Micromonospora sp. NPDC047074]|uniref:hypothetical protein n=1 Tax=Micromonospora sp. NPDC047074 TaxID=3154339 RepID=UPI0034079400
MGRVVIGMDPHRRSTTIEISNDREMILGQGRLITDRDGYQAMLKLGRQHKDRIWTVEGCNGIGRHIAQRLRSHRAAAACPAGRQKNSALWWWGAATVSTCASPAVASNRSPR